MEASLERLPGRGSWVHLLWGHSPFKRETRIPHRDATHAIEGRSEDCNRDTVVPKKYLGGQGRPATHKLLAASQHILR